MPLVGTLLLVLAAATGTAGVECRLGYRELPNNTALLPVPKFKSFACALCYLYSNPSFFKRGQLAWSIELVLDANGDFALNFTSGALWTTEIDQDNEELLKTFREDSDGKEKWKSCCSAAMDCCRDQQDNSSTRSGHCPRIWDGWSCWADAQPNTVQKGRCPNYIGKTVDENSCPPVWSSRYCFPSGQWTSTTDYTTCSSAPSVLNHNVVLLTSYGVSIATLLPALAVFGVYSRQLQGHRISLHRNFFWSLLLNAGVQMWLRFALVLPELNGFSSSVEEQDSIACRLLLLATKYFRNTNYMWMFCEGFYLHRLLSTAFATDGRLAIFYSIGWGFPLLPVGVYALLRKLNNDEECWMKPTNTFEWVLLTPNLLSLLVNLFFLADIIRILVTKLQSSPSREHANYRKAVRATLVLVPLFGLHFVITIYIPDKHFCVWREVHLYADQVLDGLQGAFVALNFCFLNGEVHALVRHSYRTMLDKYHPSLRQSRGSHSFSTQTTL